MKKIYSIALICLSFWTFGQQDLQFTQFMYNRMYYNPGVTGSGDAICVTAVHRSQWVGFDGAPTSQNINANIPISLLRGGVGLNISNDQIGFFQNLNAGLSYGYQHQLTNGTLGAGVSFDLYTKAVSNADWKAPQDLVGDLVIPAADNNNSAYFDMSFGVYYQTDRIWAGLSSSRILESAAELDGFNPTFQSITRFYNRRHYNLMGGYQWAIPGTTLDLRPSLLLKTDLVASPQVDVNVTVVHNNTFWGGVTYRLNEAVAANIGYQFTESLRAGYSYDVAISSISQQGGGSHEVFLKYCFKVEIPPREKGSYRNVRFL